MKKLAIITTHPIQYYAPVFRLLARTTELKVFYTWGETALRKYDPGFGKVIAWDIPLLDGYNYEFSDNVASDPGSHHFHGIDVPDLTERIEAFRPDAVLVYGYAYKSHWKAMRYFKGKVPVWFRGDSTLLDEKKGLKALVKWCYLRWIYRYVDKAFYVGIANKAYFKRYGLQEHQLIFAPHAIDNERFAGDRTNEAQELRRSLGICPGDKLVLFAGKLESKKAPDVLLKAFSERKAADEYLLFVGNGELEAELKAEARSKNILFLDLQNQERMPVVYQACDLFCLPSRGPGESWGLAVNEAMAGGRPVLVSDKVGCATDLVSGRGTGAVCRPDDQADLLAKFDILLNDHQTLHQMGEQAAEWIKNYSFETQVAILTTELNNA